MNKTNFARAKATYRHKLLVTVSAVALLGLVHGAAADAGTAVDRPLVWIEFGGQLNRIGGQAKPYIPPFDATAVQHGLLPIGDLEKPPLYSVGEEVGISFQPGNSDWIFSASLQYGRSNGRKHRHQDVPLPPIFVSNFPTGFQPYGPNNFSHINQTVDYTVKSGEQHTIVDFQVGKDVGLGQMGQDSSSELAFGVRIAQISASSSFNLRADPNAHLASEYIAFLGQSVPVINYYQFYKARPDIIRRFKGLGPSLSWNGSLPVIGSQSDAEVTVDWGANLAVLFGRQKTRIQHQTTGDLYTHNLFGPYVGKPKYVHNHYLNNAKTERSRSIIVPNVGGMLGVSVKFPNAKVSLGYRADFFIGAMDGGIDARKSTTRSFNGPFASLSIGLGD